MTLCNRVDPWGDLHADAGTRAVHRQPRLPGRRRPSTRAPSPRARRCGSRACCGSATGATRSTSRTAGRRCSSSMTPWHWPPDIGRARSAVAPTTGRTGTPSPALARSRRRVELDRRLASERLRRGRGLSRGGRPAAVAGRCRATARRGRRGRRTRSAGPARARGAAAIHVRRLGDADRAATRRGRTCSRRRRRSARWPADSCRGCTRRPADPSTRQLRRRRGRRGRACGARPRRTTLTPWRIGAADQPRAERTGRSRVVNTSAWPRPIVVAVARDCARGRCSTTTNSPPV